MKAEPPQAKTEPTVIGIGASAGGLAALKKFLALMPHDSGLAFVVVVHLSPDHESHLAELLQPHVHFPVGQVVDTVPLEANHVYVIPPNANLNAIDTHLRLSKLEERRQERAPIDHFFRTLARAHDGHSIAVVLTGTGSDGTLGIKDIKEHGGVVIVQDPNEAEYDGMPRSAIATGMADFILPIAEMPAAILHFDRTAPHVSAVGDGENIPHGEHRLLQNILTLLRTRTDRDFTRYKPSTILRRIVRRMQLNNIEDMQTYAQLLRDRLEEARALADDLLITVTSFFRDHQVFEKLEKEVIPQLFAGKTQHDPVRVWSVGCATGEEAYSLAIVLTEAAAKLEAPPQIQIFASDLHARSLANARDAVYSGDIETVVSPERLNRFFHRENGGYRIRKEIRGLIVFAPHNILSDPPFSRIDLISCRNLLIYLERDVQREVFGIFNYSLNPEGVLVLGTAEATETADLFRPVDKKLRIFRKRHGPSRERHLPVFPSSTSRFLVEDQALDSKRSELVAAGDLHRRMVEQYSPPSILVDPDNKLVHLSQRAGRYMAVPGGTPTTNALKLVREELQLDLQASLHASREKHEEVDTRPIPVRFEGRRCSVVMHIRPAVEPEREGFVLIIFEERSSHDEPGIPAAGATGPFAERIGDLEAQLVSSRRQTQTVVEEFEISRERTSAASEEMQSTNEELRSTLEELETSKEELQSINEELQTVNQQGRHKVEELAQLSGDLQNLLTATDIATLFLDRQLRILRFTPKLGNLFSVRVADYGRPISDLTHRLGYPELANDAHSVVNRLIPVEREVQDEAGYWYLTRVLPYRNEDRVNGVVITFIDIDARKKAEAAVAATAERLSRMINVDVVGVLIFDQTGTLIDSNDTFQKMSGYSKQEISSRTLTWRTMTPPEYVEISEGQMEKLAASGRIGPYEKEYIRKDGSRCWTLFAGATLGDGTTIEYCIDVSDRKRAERELLDSKYYADSIIETLHEPLLVLTPDLRVNSANPAFYRHFKVEPATTLGRKIYELGNGQWNIPELRHLLEEVLPANDVFEDFEVEHTFQEIGRLTMLVNGRRLERVPLILLGLRDITERKRVENEWRATLGKQKLESIGVLAGGIAHDFNNLLGGILAEAELVEMDLPAGSPIGEAIEKIKAGAFRGSEIVRELMIYSGHDKAEPAAVDVARLTEEMLKLLQVSISKHAVLKSDLPKDLPAVRGNASQLRQIVMNLIINASEAIGDMDGVISVTLSRSASGHNPQGDYLRLEVSDTGSGMTEETRARVFDPFFTTKFAGRGLGLAVVQTIVRDHGGTIHVVSAPGQGTTIQIDLPGAGEPAKPDRSAVVSTSDERIPNTAGTVLLVEDDDMFRHAVSLMLRKQGFSVIEAGNGSAAIDLFRSFGGDVDVILLDLTIPGTPSSEVVAEALRIRPGVTVVLMSAYSLDMVPPSLNVPEVKAFIRKPFETSALVRLLRDTLSADLKPPRFFVSGLD